MHLENCQEGNFSLTLDERTLNIMKKLIYTAAIAAFATSILPSTYAGDIGEEKENLGGRKTTATMTPPKTLADAMAEGAVRDLAEKERARDAEKLAKMARIEENKQRSSSLTDELLESEDIKRITERLPAGAEFSLTIKHPESDVSVTVRFGDGGEPVAREDDAEILSPVKGIRKQLQQAETLRRTESGTLISVH